MSRSGWITVGFLALLIFAALTAHAAALTISSKDTVSIATKGEGDSTTWHKLEIGDMAGVVFTGPAAVRITLTSTVDEKQKIEPVVQINPGASLVIEGNYAGGDAQIVQVGKDRIEGYYTYGRSSAYPWGIYWCVNDIGGKQPTLVYSEFSGRKVWYAPIGQKTIDGLIASLEKGDIPEITLIQQAAGA